MGNPIQEEEAAIKELSQLSRESKKWLGHHIRNAISPLVMACDCDITDEQRERLVENCFNHIAEDLRKIGFITAEISGWVPVRLH